MDPLLYTALISMVPVVELRGAIPVALASGVPAFSAACAATLGNLLPVPFILIFIRRFLLWLRARSARCRRLAAWIERRAEKGMTQVRRYAFWGLTLFVAIPLPGTGAWTSALIAALLEIRPARAFAAIAAGVVIAAAIVTLAAGGAGAILAGG